MLVAKVLPQPEPELQPEQIERRCEPSSGSGSSGSSWPPLVHDRTSMLVLRSMDLIERLASPAQTPLNVWVWDSKRYLTFNFIQFKSDFYGEGIQHCHCTYQKHIPSQSQMEGPYGLHWLKESGCFASKFPVNAFGFGHI